MAECERLKQCPFFNDKIDNMPRYVQNLKERYCLKNKDRCARNMVYRHLGYSEEIPWSLFPDDMTEAKSIIDQHSKK